MENAEEMQEEQRYLGDLHACSCSKKQFLSARRRFFPPPAKSVQYCGHKHFSPAQLGWQISDLDWRQSVTAKKDNLTQRRRALLPHSTFTQHSRYFSCYKINSHTHNKKQFNTHIDRNSPRRRQIKAKCRE